MFMFCEGRPLGRGLRRKMADRIATANPLATEIRKSRIHSTGTLQARSMYQRILT